MQFFGEAKESLDCLKNLQDAIHRKYSCDRNSSLHKLEDLVQESMVTQRAQNASWELFVSVTPSFRGLKRVVVL